MSETRDSVGKNKSHREPRRISFRIKRSAHNFWTLTKRGTYTALSPFRQLDAIGFLTAVLALLAYLQWLTLEKTDETNRVGLRPYISGVGITVDTERFPLYWALSVILENSGGTPPLEMQYVIRSAPELPLDPEDIFQHPSETDAFFWNTIAPKGRITVNGGKVLTTFISSGAMIWYLIGSIHYRDEFRGTPKHISKFCFSMVATKDFKANVMRPAYDACPYWNCVDQIACSKDRQRYDQAVKAGDIRPTGKSTDIPNVPIGTDPSFPDGNHKSTALSTKILRAFALARRMQYNAERRKFLFYRVGDIRDYSAHYNAGK